MTSCFLQENENLTCLSDMHKAQDYNMQWSVPMWPNNCSQFLSGLVAPLMSAKMAALLST